MNRTRTGQPMVPSGESHSIKQRYRPFGVWFGFSEKRRCLIIYILWFLFGGIFGTTISFVAMIRTVNNVQIQFSKSGFCLPEIPKKYSKDD